MELQRGRKLDPPRALQAVIRDARHERIGPDLTMGKKYPIIRPQHGKTAIGRRPPPSAAGERDPTDPLFRELRSLEPHRLSQWFTPEIKLGVGYFQPGEFRIGTAGNLQERYGAS